MRRVYFIKPVGMDGPIKIGCSLSPDNRRDTLAGWSPFALEVVAEIAGDFVLERRFHARFEHTHQRREWFAWSQELGDCIAAINSGSFDIETLPPPRSIIHTGTKLPWWHGRQSGLSSRIAHAEHRTGYRAPCRPHDVYKLEDFDRLHQLEAFLAEPAASGIPIEAPWAAKAREAQKVTP